MSTPSQPAMPYPMTFGQTLDRIYRLMRSQLKLFLAVASVPAVAMVAIMALFFAIAFIPILAQLPKQPDPTLMIRLMIPSMLLIMPLSLAVFALYLAASIHAAMQANLGLTISFREAYAVAWKHIGRYLWLFFLAYIISFLPMLLLELLLFGATGLLSANNAEPNPALLVLIPLLVLLFIGAMVYGTIIAMRLSLAFPAALAEDLPAVAALRRSGQLTQGAKGRIFLVLLVVYALGYAAEMVGFMVLAAVIGVGALIMAACGVQMPSVAGIIGLVLAGLCVIAVLYLWTALLWSAFSTSFAVLYHDQRLRKGGQPAALPSSPMENQA
jgi:hypothetical protein